MLDVTESPYVPALRKGLALLELLAEQGPMTLAQVERASGLNRTMSYRLLRVMGELGYIEHDPVRHQYELGFRLLGLGAAAASRLNLAEIAWEPLRAARDETGETIALGVLAGTRIVYLTVLDGVPELAFATRFSGEDAPHVSAVGKAILAFLPQRTREVMVAALSAQPPKRSGAITGAEALEQELACSRERGYALEDEECERGMRGVGVPVFDAHGQPIAALGLTGPVERVDLSRADRIAERLWQASREVSRRIGHAPEALAS